MSNVDLFCRVATTLSKTGGIDEDAFRQYLQTLVDVRMGVYLGAAGSGEGHYLTRDELRRVYEVGVEVCKGKVPVYGNPPERPTVDKALAHINLAVEAGVDVVNVYGPPGWHSFRATDAEYVAFHDAVLPAIRIPVALSPNPALGYAPGPAVIADLCRRYPQVVAVNLVFQPDEYFIELKNRLTRDVPLYVHLTGSIGLLLLGAAGIVGGSFDMIPKTSRRYIDLYNSRQFEEAARVYADMKRFIEYVGQWRPADARWIKMMMKVLRLPGGEGGVRAPYLMPGEDELRRFTDGLLRLRLPEIDDLARAAGLTIPV